MPAVNKEQIAAANLNYRMYPLEFFLDTQKELGLRSIEFCAVAPHFLMDYEGYRDTAPIRAMAEEKGLQMGAVDFIRKPFEPNRVLECVQKVLEA